MIWNKRFINVLSLITEASWIAVIFSLLSMAVGIGSNAVAYPYAILMGITSYLQTRWIVSMELPEFPARLLSVLLLLITIYLVLGFSSGEGLTVFRTGWVYELITANSPILRSLAVGSVALSVFWWSGVRHGLSSSPGQHIVLTFRIGIPIVLFGAISSTFFPTDIGITTAIYSFFISGFSALALSQVIALNFDQHIIRGVWGRSIIISLVIIICGSIILTFLANTGVGSIAIFAVDLLMQGIRLLLLGLAFVLGYLTEFVVNLIAPLLSDNINETLDRMATAVSEMGQFEERTNEQANPLPWLPTAIRWGFGTIFLLIGALIVKRLFKRRRGIENSEGINEEHELLPITGSTKNDLATVIGKVLSNLVNKTSQDKKNPVALTGPRGIAYRTYFYFLILARRSGLNRGRSETPLEFYERAIAKFPPEEIQTLTQIFSDTRYGNRDPSQEEITKMKSAWNKIRESVPSIQSDDLNDNLAL